MPLVLVNIDDSDYINFLKLIKFSKQNNIDITLNLKNANLNHENIELNNDNIAVMLCELVELNVLDKTNTTIEMFDIIKSQLVSLNNVCQSSNKKNITIDVLEEIKKMIKILEKYIDSLL